MLLYKKIQILIILKSLSAFYQRYGMGIYRLMLRSNEMSQIPINMIYTFLKRNSLEYNITVVELRH